MGLEIWEIINEEFHTRFSEAVRWLMFMLQLLHLKGKIFFVSIIVILCLLQLKLEGQTWRIVLGKDHGKRKFLSLIPSRFSPRGWATVNVEK